MTKKDLLEAIKDMPEDAEVLINIGLYNLFDDILDIFYEKEKNQIKIC